MHHIPEREARELLLGLVNWSLQARKKQVMGEIVCWNLKKTSLGLIVDKMGINAVQEIFSFSLSELCIYLSIYWLTASNVYLIRAFLSVACILIFHANTFQRIHGRTGRPTGWSCVCGPSPQLHSSSSHFYRTSRWSALTPTLTTDQQRSSKQHKNPIYPTAYIFRKVIFVKQ